MPFKKEEVLFRCSFTGFLRGSPFQRVKRDFKHHFSSFAVFLMARPFQSINGDLKNHFFIFSVISSIYLAFQAHGVAPIALIDKPCDFGTSQIICDKLRHTKVLVGSADVQTFTSIAGFSRRVERAARQVLVLFVDLVLYILRQSYWAA